MGSRLSRDRLPPLSLSAVAITVAFGAVRFMSHFLADRYEEDFRLNYVAAKIGLTYSWSQIYDLDLERRLSAAFSPAGSVIEPRLSTIIRVGVVRSAVPGINPLYASHQNN
jgi:hypothetical protein